MGGRGESTPVTVGLPTWDSLLEKRKEESVYGRGSVLIFKYISVCDWSLVFEDMQ